MSENEPLNFTDVESKRQRMGVLPDTYCMKGLFCPTKAISVKEYSGTEAIDLCGKSVGDDK